MPALPAPFMSASAPIFELDDLIPERHLFNLAGGGTKNVGIVGDSQSCWYPTPNAIDLTQTKWSAVRSALRRKNPGITWNFDASTGTVDVGNFAIPGTYMANINQTLAATGATIPSWGTDTSKPWLYYPQQASLDVLLVAFGINFPNQGTAAAAGSANSAFQLVTMLNTIAAWPKVPNIVFITNDVANPAAAGFSNAEYYKGQAAFIRTFCRSHGKTFKQLWPNIPQLQQFGLIDIGRFQAAAAYGKDYANQYLQSQPSSIASGIVLGTSPVQIGTTTDGDFAMTLVFPGEGYNAFYSAGVNKTTITLGTFTGNVLTFSTGSASGGFSMAYSAVTNGSAENVTGATISLPSGNLTMVISFRQEQMRITINGNLYLETSVPRWVCGGPITINTNAAPTSTLTMNVTGFYEGFALGASVGPASGAEFGDYLDNTVDAAGPGGGNNNNHLGSKGNALADYGVINASRLSAPAAVPPTIGVISAAGTTLATATALTSYYNWVTGGTGGVVLPANLPQQRDLWVYNRSGAAITVYPDNATDLIESGSAGAGVSLASGADAHFVRVSATQWLQ